MERDNWRFLGVIIFFILLGLGICMLRQEDERFRKGVETYQVRGTK